MSSASSTVVVEIRPGEGGDDALAFATDLAAAFAAYARRQGCHPTVHTGRTLTVSITGPAWPGWPFSGSGPGGQHRNKSEQCARLTHRPTGTVVVATASRSQRQNIQTAFAELQRRLAAAAGHAVRSDRNRRRRSQIASGERPTKQWTWNDQRGEVIDHATDRRYPIAAFLNGRLGDASHGS